MDFDKKKDKEFKLQLCPQISKAPPQGLYP
jgi:hypothetical protein